MPLSARPARDVPDCCGSASAPRSADPRIARHFDRHVDSVVAKGGLPALHATSRWLLEALVATDDVAPTVLELGCGTGGLTVSLAEAGASAAQGIDLSPTSIELARARARRAGVAERVAFEVGDGASARLEPHDWVVLDRVFCCYGDLDALLANSTAAARRRYAFSVPISRGIRGVVNRAIVTAENATNRLRGAPCPGFAHDVGAIERRLADGGFRPQWTGRTGLWHVAVFEREGGTTA